jgi:hypothetical protein
LRLQPSEMCVQRALPDAENICSLTFDHVVHEPTCR